MNKIKKSPIGCMADLLAEMSERVMEAEREKDAAKEDAENWYLHYLEKSEQLKAAEAKLTAQMEENEEIMNTIAECIGQLEENEENEEIMNTIAECIGRTNNIENTNNGEQDNE